MEWFNKWFAKKCKQAWDDKNRFEEDNIKMNSITVAGFQKVDRSRTEGENHINFELSSAIGGKILNVRHYDDRKGQHENQTYVIPNGEDIGERVSKIINLEMFKL